jgi:arylsulfatase A-like enzyme
LDTVEESGQKDNTIIVFTADHGDNLGSHGRNGKGLPYEEALRIPMIYSYPEKLTSKVDGECIASLLDIAPTLLSNSGIEIPSHMAGKDVLHENLNHTICEIIPGNFLLRTDRFTIQASKSKNEDNLICRAFFDNQNDPYQMTNYNESEKFSNEINEGLSTLEAFHKNVSIMPKPDYRFKKP